MKLDASRSGSPAGARSGRRVRISPQQRRRSRCGPRAGPGTDGRRHRRRPGAGWGRGPTSKVSGSENTVAVAVGRAVEHHHLVARRDLLGADRRCRPWRSGGSARPATCSAASPPPRSGARRRDRPGAAARWSGCSNSSWTPAATRLRVVSPPALTRSRKNHWNSPSVRRSPSTSAATSAVAMSSPGWARFSPGHAGGVAEHLGDRVRGRSGADDGGVGGVHELGQLVQPLAVGARNAHQLGDQPRRQPPGDVGHQVALAGAGDLGRRSRGPARRSAGASSSACFGVNPRLTSGGTARAGVGP